MLLLSSFFTHLTVQLVRLLDNDFYHIIDEYIIFDCRFAYEYEGGHIRQAVNVNTHEDLLQLLFPNGMANAQQSCIRRALVFHCEFSSHRAPKMALFLRSQDRVANGANYPNLYFPEIYVLEGGYKEFYAHNKVKFANYL
jgi:M-phase inducer tyrosine phosphatase